MAKLKPEMTDLLARLDLASTTYTTVELSASEAWVVANLIRHSSEMADIILRGRE